MDNSPKITDWLIVILTAGYLIATVVYVIVSWRLLKANTSALRSSQEVAEASKAMAEANRLMVEEMKLTRSVQVRTMTDAIFFQLIGLHNDILGNLRWDIGPVITGRQVTDELARRLRQHYGTARNKDENRHIGEEEFLRRSLEAFFAEYQGLLGHYMHHLYRILQFVAERNDADDVFDSQFYIKTLRAQLSTSEVVLLFYAGLVENGRKKKALIERYGLLEDLPRNRLLKEEHKERYALGAYQEGKS